MLGVGSVRLEATATVTATADGTGVAGSLGVAFAAAEVTAISTPTIGAYGVGGGGSITGSDMTFSTHLNSGLRGRRHGVRHRHHRQRRPRRRPRGADVMAVDSPTVTTGLGSGSTAAATGAVTLTTDVVIKAVVDATTVAVGAGAGAGLTIVDAIAGGCAAHHTLPVVGDLPFRSGCSTSGAGAIESRFGNLTSGTSFTGTTTVDESSDAHGIAVAGALLGSLNGSVMNASTTEPVRTRMGTLTVSGDASVLTHVTSDASPRRRRSRSRSSATRRSS